MSGSPDVASIARDSGNIDRTASAALQEFERWYLENASTLREAVEAISRILRSTFDEMREELAVHDVRGRAKSLDSCVMKYNTKYRADHEKEGCRTPIVSLLTDLVGVRIICLYEDDIARIAERVRTTFEVIGETDKIAAINQQADRFGYKALHYDVHLGAPRGTLGEYRKFAQFAVELQIRTVFQDA